MADRVLPHDIDAERALLGAVMVAPRIWPQVAAAVTVGDFYRAAHADIYLAMSTLAEREIGIDFVTLKDELSRRGKLDSSGGPLYLTQLLDVGSSHNATSYVSVVREKARLRAVTAHAQAIADAAHAGDRPASELADELVRRLVATVAPSASEIIDATTAVRDYATALATGSAGEPVRTGFADVDDLLGGFRRGDLVIVAARPSVGKTSWALGAALHIAVATGVVPFFSLEMQAAGLAERLLAWEAGVSMQAAVRGTATVDEYAAINVAVERFAAPGLRIQAVASSLAEIEARCMREQHERGLAAVVVDYLQLLAPTVRAPSGEQAVAAISAGLKRLAKRLDAPVIALSQLSRAPEGRTDKRPHLSDLRGSGALEQDADVAILLHRQEMHQRTPENDGVAEVIVAKHRSGPTGIVRMYFDKNLARFSALETTRGDAYGEHESRDADRQSRPRRRAAAYAGRDRRFYGDDGDD